MKWSFQIGRVFGIELRVHVTFFLIVAWAAYMWGVYYEGGAAGAIYGSFLILLLFGCVVIHELCHSRMAQHYGAEVDSITLLPIGGVSLLKKMPEEPRKEMWVSLVGPASNIVIAAVLFVVLELIPGKRALNSEQAILDIITGISVQGLVTYLLFINVMLAFFNLIPAFPLDGGRVLRSILAQKMSYSQATRAAVTAGQVFAFMLGFAGLYLGQWIWILIAIFIYFGAQQEGSQAQVKDVLSKLKVVDAMTGQVKVLSPSETLGDVASFMLHSYQEDFPVVEDGRLLGILTSAQLVKGLRDAGPEGRTGDAMETKFPTVSADAPISEVYDKINQTRVKAVPVVEDGRLLGIVTLEHLSDVFMLLTSSEKPFYRRR
jgi:Zn-dependent protease/CBS domain-containing protein